ncbi:MAG: phosphoribosyltransferase [Rhodospirillaceae bacterium]
MSNKDIEKIYISGNELLRDSIALGMKVLRSGFRPTHIVGVWRGGAPVGIAVQEVLEYHGLDTDHIAIRTSSYYGIDKQAALVKVYALDYLIDTLRPENSVLIVDDVFDSGRSIEAILAELAKRCRNNLARDIRVATAYYKPLRNKTQIKPDFYVHETDKWLIFPHELKGLTHEEILAHKPVDASFFEV